MTLRLLCFLYSLSLDFYLFLPFDYLDSVSVLRIACLVARYYTLSFYSCNYQFALLSCGLIVTSLLSCTGVGV